MISEQYRNSRIEALILASPEPLPGRRICQVVEELTPHQVARAVAELNSSYAASGSSFRIRQLAGGFQFYILPEYVGLIEELFTRRRVARLSRAALETVAIIAYRQPTSRADIEHIRGVASDGVIRTLLERGLVTITGRASGVGKPLQYGTTDEFLKLFGLASLDDLPKMSEIEQLVSAAEDRHQTELQLEMDAEGKLVKLNVADGTFDPERRERLDDEPGNGSRGGVRLVLQRTSEAPQAVADLARETSDEPVDRPELAESEKDT